MQMPVTIAANRIKNIHAVISTPNPHKQDAPELGVLDAPLQVTS
jgi:hypothetical protein